VTKCLDISPPEAGPNRPGRHPGSAGSLCPLDACVVCSVRCLHLIRLSATQPKKASFSSPAQVGALFSLPPPASFMNYDWSVRVRPSFCDVIFPLLLLLMHVLVGRTSTTTYELYGGGVLPPFVRQSRFFRALVSPSLCCATLTTINNKITISSFPEDNDELITIC
jgi:hypothetical protein